MQSRYYDPVVGRFLNADYTKLIGANGGVQGYNLFTLRDTKETKRIPDLVILSNE